MAPFGSPFDYQFEKLMRLHEEGSGEELFAELLRHGPTIFDPLSEYLIKLPNSPRIAILIQLIGKCMDDRAVPLLMRFLEIPVPELRRAAANALGWSRARVALEALDDLVGNDPDERVRNEAKAALEEILRDYPKLSGLLRYHRPLELLTEEAARVSPEDPDRVRLLASLPRLLAAKYNAIPLRFTDEGRLQMAVRHGSERRLIPTLCELTGQTVELLAWSQERILKAIEKHYTFGDADFCAYVQALNPIAKAEIAELILAGIRPDEPVCPLSEVDDAVEAVQVFLSCCGAMSIREVLIRHVAPSMQLEAVLADGAAMNLDAPTASSRSAFLTTLLFLAATPVVPDVPASCIPCLQGGIRFLAFIRQENVEEGTLLRIRIEEVA